MEARFKSRVRDGETFVCNTSQSGGPILQPTPEQLEISGKIVNTTEKWGFFVNNKLYRKEVETIKSLLKLNISINLWFRIKNFLQLRRRLRDAFALLILSILGLY